MAQNINKYQRWEPLIILPLYLAVELIIVFLNLEHEKYIHWFLQGFCKTLFHPRLVVYPTKE